MAITYIQVCTRCLKLASCGRLWWGKSMITRLQVALKGEGKPCQACSAGMKDLTEKWPHIIEYRRKYAVLRKESYAS